MNRKDEDNSVSEVVDNNGDVVMVFKNPDGTVIGWKRRGTEL
jgi:hypothetical protein